MQTKTGKVVILLSVVYILSILYSLTYVDSFMTTSYNWGFVTGLAFGQALKILGAIGLITYGIHKIRRRGLKTLQ